MSTRDWPTPPASVGLALTATAVGVVSVFSAGWLWLHKPTLIVPAAVVVLLVTGAARWQSQRRLRSYIAYDEAQDHEYQDQWENSQ